MIKEFSIVNEIEVFLEFPCFFCYPMDVGHLISDSSAFYKSSLVHLDILDSYAAEV